MAAKQEPKPAPGASKTVRVSEELAYRLNLYAVKNRRKPRAVLDEAISEYLKSKKAQ